MICLTCAIETLNQRLKLFIDHLKLYSTSIECTRVSIHAFKQRHAYKWRILKCCWKITASRSNHLKSFKRLNVKWSRSSSTGNHWLISMLQKGRSEFSHTLDPTTSEVSCQGNAGPTPQNSARHTWNGKHAIDDQMGGQTSTGILSPFNKWR